MDVHFREAPFDKNIPVLLGLASVWNVSFLGYPARAILPYTQALSKLAPHIQQVGLRLLSYSCLVCSLHRWPWLAICAEGCACITVQSRVVSWCITIAKEQVAISKAALPQHRRHAQCDALQHHSPH